MLLTCKVPMEEAYATLLDNYSHKLQEGILYDSGEVDEGEAKTDKDNAMPLGGKKRRGEAGNRQPKKCQSSVERSRQVRYTKFN